MNKPTEIEIVIFDIDGCISDDRHRLGLLPAMTNDNGGAGRVAHDAYDDYHRHAREDKVFSSAACWFNAQRNRLLASEGKIVFITARPEWMRAETAGWLAQNLNFSFGSCFQGPRGTVGHFELRMRPEGNLTSSVVLKDQIVNEMIEAHGDLGFNIVNITEANDDREDVLAMYAGRGINCNKLDADGLVPFKVLPPMRFAAFTEAHPTRLHPSDVLADEGPYSSPVEHVTGPKSGAVTGEPAPEVQEVAAILHGMADTLDSRSADYGYNAGLVARLLAEMFPKGITLKTAADFEMWHLFELTVVKQARFVNSDLTHRDSVHDGSIYGGFCERLVDKHNIIVHK